MSAEEEVKLGDCNHHKGLVALTRVLGLIHCMLLKRRNKKLLLK